MSNVESLRLACLLYPEDDGLLLILADALAERGNEGDAVQEAMIRAQLDPTPDYDRENCEACREGGIADCPSCRKRGRIATLLTLGQDFQSPSFPYSLGYPFDNTTKGGIWHVGTSPIDHAWIPTKRDSHQHWARCERGMIREIRCGSLKWKYSGEAICSQQPIDRVTLWDVQPRAFLTRCPETSALYTAWEWCSREPVYCIDIFDQPPRSHWHIAGQSNDNSSLLQSVGFRFDSRYAAESWLSMWLIGWARWQGANRYLFADDPWRGLRMAWNGSERVIPAYGSTPAEYLASLEKSKL